MDSDYAPGGRPLTGRKVLAIAIGFFAVVATANGAMIYAGLSTFPGLVVKNSYVESQRFNTILAEDKAQQALGWRHELGYQGGRLRLAFSGPEGAVEGLRLSGRIERPSDARADKALEFAPLGGGIYEAPADLGRGIWEARLEAQGPKGELYRIIERLLVKE